MLVNYFQPLDLNELITSRIWYQQKVWSSNSSKLKNWMHYIQCWKRIFLSQEMIRFSLWESSLKNKEASVWWCIVQGKQGTTGILVTTKCVWRRLLLENGPHLWASFSSIIRTWITIFLCRNRIYVLPSSLSHHNTSLMLFFDSLTAPLLSSN